MEDKNEHIRYYILFDNHTQGTDGKAACGMALLIHPDDIEAARTCIEENNAEYVSIVPLENQLHKKRDRYC